MQMKKQVMLGFLLLGLYQLSGQEPTVRPLQFSLDQALSYAVANNLTAENARLDIEAAGKRVWETAAGGLPQASASVNYNNNLALATTLIPDFLGDPSDKIAVQFGTKHFATAGIGASQLVFSGQYIVGLQTAKLFREFTTKSLELTEQSVKESVTQGYFLVLLSENMLEALEGNLENITQTYNETRELFKAGFLEETDVDQLEVSRTDLENAVASMQRQEMATRNLLKYQMGLDFSASIELTDNLEDLARTIDIQAIMGEEMNVENNIDYQLLDDQERLALMDMKLRRTDFMPTISAFFSLDYTAQRDEFNFFDNSESWYNASSIGLSFNIPLFSSGARLAGVAQKRIAWEQARNNKEFAVNAMRVEFIQAQYDFANAYEKYRREEKNLGLTDKLVKTTQIKYSEGMVSSLELTQVNDQYLQTLGNFTSAMVELLNAKISLDVLLNKL